MSRSTDEDMKRDYFLKTCLVKDLRVECRSRGISPAGSRDTLVERLAVSMAATGDTSFTGGPVAVKDIGSSVNNYTRPEGQNVGNFLTDRSSSRVSAPPGGKSSVHFFGETAPSAVVEDRTRRSMSPPAVPPPPRATQDRPMDIQRPPQPTAQTQAQTQPQPPSLGPPGLGPQQGGVNNYSRPGDRQNVGNYITGRNTSRVLAPPGGGSSFTFG